MQFLRSRSEILRSSSNLASRADRKAGERRPRTLTAGIRKFFRGWSRGGGGRCPEGHHRGIAPCHHLERRRAVLARSRRRTRGIARLSSVPAELRARVPPSCVRENVRDTKKLVTPPHLDVTKPGSSPPHPPADPCHAGETTLWLSGPCTHRAPCRPGSPWHPRRGRPAPPGGDAVPVRAGQCQPAVAVAHLFGGPPHHVPHAMRTVGPGYHAVRHGRHFVLSRCRSGCDRHHDRYRDRQTVVRSSPCRSGTRWIPVVSVGGP